MIETDNYLDINELLDSFKELEKQFKVKVVKVNSNCIFIITDNDDVICINKNGFVCRNGHKLSEELEKVIVYLISKRQLINWDCQKGFYAKPELQTDLERYAQWLAMENKLLKQEIEELRNELRDHESRYDHECSGY